MKFSHKFLIFVFSIVVFTIGVNIVALKYFTTEYFSEYLASIKQEVPDINFDLLSAFTNTKNLDDATIAEYKTILGDLSNISHSLENFSNNPRAYAPSVIDSLQKIGVPENSIEQVLFVKAIDSFFGNIFNFSFLHNTTAEGHFVIRVIGSMLAVNVGIIVTVLILAYVWVKLSFRPVQSIIENLSDIIHRRGHKRIKYGKKDEFGALVDTINALGENLSYQEKIRSDLLSDLSHEIKTPITAIKCYLEGMEDGVIEMNERNRKLLNKEIDRLIDITGTIMEYEKLEQQDVSSLHIERVDITEIIRLLTEEYGPSLKKRNQEVILHNEKRFFVFVDQDKCIQLLHNIFSNFIKYAGKGTTLSIKLARRNNLVHLTFADNGNGIPSEEIAFVKEKFYQVEKSRTNTSKNGLGIGLSIIEKIVRMHAGTCTIESESGKGFLLSISLPSQFLSAL